MGLAHPGAFAVMLALFAMFGFGNEDVTTFAKLFSVLTVALGSILYWFFFTWIFAKMKGKINVSKIVIINRIAGVAVALFGIYLIVVP